MSVFKIFLTDIWLYSDCSVLLKHSGIKCFSLQEELDRMICTKIQHSMGPSYLCLLKPFFVLFLSCQVQTDKQIQEMICFIWYCRSSTHQHIVNEQKPNCRSCEHLYPPFVSFFFWFKLLSHYSLNAGFKYALTFCDV